MKLNKVGAILLTASFAMPAFSAESTTKVVTQAVDTTAVATKSLAEKARDFFATKRSEPVTGITDANFATKSKSARLAEGIKNAAAKVGNRITEGASSMYTKTAELLKPVSEKAALAYRNLTGKITASGVYKNISEKVSKFYTNHPTSIKVTGVVVGAAAILGIGYKAYQAYVAKHQPKKN